MKEENKTIRLYDDDAYATEFTGVVLDCKEVPGDKDNNGQSCYNIILDRTLFFPEEGGQSPDKGTINGIPVVDVQIKNDVIIHTLTEPLQEGSRIDGKVDWDHRFSNMQQHSAEHIFSGVVHREYRLNNVGFHLSESVVTMDFDGVLTPEQIQDIEWKVNRAIAENVEIEARYPEREELQQLEYRSKIEINGPVRIVTIPGYDVCACCAPHVKRTGEIGILKVMNVQNYKGGVRVSILCGFRALAEYREKSRVVSELMHLLSAGQDTLFERVSRIKETNNELKVQLNALKQEALLGKIKEIPADEKNVLLFADDLDTAIVRTGVNTLVEKHKGVCGIFVGNDTDGYRFILGSSLADCNEIAGKLRKEFQAKCGGSNAMIQGSLLAPEKRIREFFEI